MKILYFYIFNIFNSIIWVMLSLNSENIRLWVLWLFILAFFVSNTLVFSSKRKDRLLENSRIIDFFIITNMIMALAYIWTNGMMSLTYRMILTFFVLTALMINTVIRRQEIMNIHEMKDLLDIKIQEIGELHNITNAINSVLDLERLLDMVLSVTVEVLKVKRVSLFLFDEEKENLVLKISKGLEKELFNNLKIPAGSGIIGLVGRTGRPLLIKDIEREMPEFYKPSVKNSEYQDKSFLCVPLKIKSETIGVLSVNDKENREVFNENDLELLNILSTQIAVAIENANLIDNMKDNYKSTIMALSHAIDAKDSYTGGHSSQVTKYSIPIARELGFDKAYLDMLEYAGLLHDIGKIGIIENILNKKGRLTDEEFSIIKKHPSIGAEILGGVAFLSDVIPLVKYHHERWDGNGYPDGLKGEDIPIGARIIAVADTFDAMTSDRPYRKGLPAEVAKNEVERCSGTQFDPRVVKAFLKVYDKGDIKVEKYESVNRWI